MLQASYVELITPDRTKQDEEEADRIESYFKAMFPARKDGDE